MGRPPRYIPENKNGVLVEVTCRAIGGRALLTPGPNPFKFNDLVAGILGRGLEISPRIDLCSAIFASTHYHLHIPRQADHLFRGKATTDSKARRTPIPG